VSFARDGSCLCVASCQPVLPVPVREVVAS
jgi:hypothetical protein